MKKKNTDAGRQPPFQVLMRYLPILMICVSTSLGGGFHQGLNIPPTQGSSNAGAFEPGVYRFDYEPDLLKRIKEEGFTHIRVGVNVESAMDSATMNRIASLFASVDYQGVICMFDTNEAGETGHGNGRPNDLKAMTAAWRNIHSGFKDKPGIMYELFNEPFGYSTDRSGAREYLKEMGAIIKGGGLPADRCILDGLGYAGRLNLVEKAGWKGALAYHFYPNWLPENQGSRENFTQCILDQVEDIPNEIYITEFGGRLNMGDVYETADDDADRNIAALQGMYDALIELKNDGQKIRGAYHWHGWDNGDSYSSWDPNNQHGMKLVKKIVQAWGARDLIIVAGQSNAVGFDSDPDELRKDAMDERVTFWWRCGDPPPDDHDSTSRKWETLQPQPRGTPNPADWATRQYGNFRFEHGGFGPEIGMARRLMKKQDRSLAIIKVAFSGTSLAADWNPAGSGEGGACYRALVEEVKKARMEAGGAALNLRAFVWVQGESDSGAQRAAAYEQNLERMLESLKTDLNVPQFKVLLGVNTRFNDGEAVQAVADAQKRFADRMDWAAYVDTSGASLANGQHFNAIGALDVGRRFAEALMKLEMTE